MKAFVNRKGFFPGRVCEEGISKFICFGLFVNSVARVENLENWVVMMP